MTIDKRMIAATLTVGLLSGPVWAQEGLRSASLPERNLRSPDPSARVDQFRAGPRTYAPLPDPRFPRDPRHQRFPPGFEFFPAASFVAPWAPYGYPVGVPFEQESGYLLTQVTPGTSEVLVDGLYVGSAEDLRRTGRGQALEPGPHRLELRAPGYQSVTVDVLIAPGETLVYRRDLQPTPRPAAPPPPPGMPKTFYVIPGCYAGDKPPGSVRLPPNCDAAKARTIAPQVSIVRVGATSPAP